MRACVYVSVRLRGLNDSLKKNVCGSELGYELIDIYKDHPGR